MKKVLPLLVISQFFCVSPWFAGNAILANLMKMLAIDASFLAHLTSAVQIGFIVGTLVFAMLSIADRFSPSLVFFTCSLLSAASNLGITIEQISPTGLLFSRLLTGFFLAGIYPVGMKIAADYYQAGLGKSLGFLVGALVFGTAFPHLLKSLDGSLPWQYIPMATSALSVFGGLLILVFVPDGPYRKFAQKINFKGIFEGFQNQNFRSAAFGYFGHMWELYAFWAFLPLILANYKQNHPYLHFEVSLYAFFIIASGGIACMLSGIFSARFGLKKLGTLCLFSSACCCLLSPVFLTLDSFEIFFSFLVFWGMVVAADSPLFSSLVAQNAPPATKGSSITLVNCLGFSITIISIQLLQVLAQYTPSQYLYLFLAIGPILGLTALIRK
jgi:MFS family permease